MDCSAVSRVGRGVGVERAAGLPDPWDKSGDGEADGGLVDPIDGFLNEGEGVFRGGSTVKVADGAGGTVGAVQGVVRGAAWAIKDGSGWQAVRDRQARRKRLQRRLTCQIYTQFMDPAR